MGEKQALEYSNISMAREGESYASVEAFDSMKEGFAPSANKTSVVAALPEVLITEKQPAALTQDQIADEMLKNPAVFHGVLRSSMQNWRQTGWGGVEHAEVTRIANDPSREAMERKAAQLVDKNFDLFAGLYSSRRKLDTGDLDEFAASLKLDRCGSSLMADAATKAAKYGLGVYGVSKMFGSDQAGWNTAVGVTTSLFANLIIEGIRKQDKEKIEALNYFNIPKC